MPLPPPNLDDRSFQDIVDETKRMIPRFTPEWTNHNVSDPGVALIELFAWMSEMVLFRVNQVPERLFVHFLNLVGIEPFPPTAAHADLTFWLAAPATTPISVPAGTQVATTPGTAPATTSGTPAATGNVGATGATGADGEVVFATTTDAVVVPPRLIAAHTTRANGGSQDGWADITYDDGALVCFPTDPVTPGDATYFGFAEPLAGLAVQLTVRASAQGIGVNPSNPPLAWEVWTGDAWAPAQVHEDSTGGLNRDGTIVLLVPRAHEPVTLAGTAACWLRVRLLHPRPGQPTYQASPRISSLAVAAVGVTVPAEHAVTAPTESIGRSSGQPGQTFRLTHAPVVQRRAGEVVRVITREGVEDWTEVPDFSSSGPDDRHVVWEATTGEIRFGPRVRYPDGTFRQHGAVPPDGAAITVSCYRYGGGADGNVGVRTLTRLRATLPSVAAVENLQPASGGVDAETVEEAKVRGPLSLRTGGRAVTAGDYERITRETSVEVARARALPARETRDGSVRVLVVPQVRTPPNRHRIDDFALSDALFSAVRDALEARRPVGVAVEVGTPFYQGVSAAVLVRALPGRPAALVRQRVLDVLNRFVNPVTGGPDGTGWPFETELTAATISQVAGAVEGVERVEEVVLFEYDLRTGRRLGSGQDTLRLDPYSLFLSAEHRVVVR